MKLDFSTIVHGPRAELIKNDPRNTHQSFHLNSVFTILNSGNLRVSFEKEKTQGFMY